MSKQKTIDKTLNASRYLVREALRNAGLDNATIDDAMDWYDIVIQQEYKYILREI